MKYFQKIILILLVIVSGYGAVDGQQKIPLNSSTIIQWKVKADADLPVNKQRPFNLVLNTQDWVTAVVPGTIFNSYVVAGLEKDPNFGDNIYNVDKKKYDRNFWYRTEFSLPENYKAEKTWLNFEGINRKGDIYFNNEFLGKLDGFMERGKFDVSKLLRKDKPNVIAVLAYWPQTPITNYASPTYISSSSWDWMPYVPGLNMGITDDVYLTSSGDVTINDPWIRTDQLTEGNANLSLNVELNNQANVQKEGILSGTIQPGNISFRKKVTIGANRQEIIRLNSHTTKELAVKNPKLWWPNGYGEPSLYVASLKLTIKDEISDSTHLTFGIKKYSYDTVGNVLHIMVNGKRIFVKGGNWGMSEYMLRCRGAEYDLKVRLHKEMNFNMIRNWIGSVTDEEFYEACDKYGMMVWDDFWLNSHPNLPTDVFAFNKNAVEKIKRLRNHPSVAVWCGDNESDPLPPLNNWLQEDVSVFDGGDRLYQPNSHAGALTGSGPWTNFNPEWYFTKSPNGFGGNKGWGFRTEIGTAVFTTFDSFKKFMPKDSWWPRNEMWNKHFFGKSAANAGPDNYERAINRSYGTATGIEDFCRKAQLVNIETNKALYEGWQHHMWKDASGVMTWMSQSAYPSMVWQTYDYYYDLNGAYWGVKKACEPVHIQWDAADNSVNVVNTGASDLSGLKAEAIIYDIKGNVIRSLGKSATLSSTINTSLKCFTLDFDSYTDNLGYHKAAYASSSDKEHGNAGAVSDGITTSRWSSDYSDKEWVYLDLGTSKSISAVVLNWEAAYATAYSLEISGDAKNWTPVYTATNAKGGYEFIKISPVRTRYVRMLGKKRATKFGYSLYDFEVYESQKPITAEVNFIKLLLKDKNGKVLSDNFYWRSNRNADYTALNALPAVKIKTVSKIIKQNGRYMIQAILTNTSSTPAFAITVQALRSSNGERILPAIMNDDYFTLMKGESKQIKIDFEENQLPDGKYKLSVQPYNNSKK